MIRYMVIHKIGTIATITNDINRFPNEYLTLFAAIVPPCLFNKHLPAISVKEIIPRTAQIQQAILIMPSPGYFTIYLFDTALYPVIPYSYKHLRHILPLNGAKGI